MNELLLVLLIVFTLMTFLSLNKKMGKISDTTPLPLPAIPPEFIKETKVLYSSREKEYNRLWTVTSIAGEFVQGVKDTQKEMTVIYHQLCNTDNLLQYQQSDNANQVLDVCVISSISDVQYRHVLLPADFKI